MVDVEVGCTYCELKGHNSIARSTRHGGSRIIEAPELEFENGVRLTITVEDRAFSVDRLVSLETWSEANRVPRARLVFFEGGGDDPGSIRIPWRTITPLWIGSTAPP